MTPELFESICRSWQPKGFRLSFEEFASFARERQGAEPPAQARLEELYLTCACTRGEPRALSELEGYLQGLRPAIQAVDATPAFVEDVLQELRVKLLSPGSGKVPQVAQFRGDSSLRTWLKAVATRTALNRLRTKPPFLHGHSEVPTPAEAGLDADLAILGSQFRAAFAETFQKAWLELDSEQRNLLRLHVMEGLGIDQLAPVFQVHRSTAARKIVQAREELVKRTKKLLTEHLSIPAQELEQLLGIVSSRLDVSMRRFLERTAD